MSANNAVAFTNVFLEYLVVFGVSVVVVLVACFLGVTMRKRKNAKLELEAAGADQTGGTEPENTTKE